MNSKKHTALSCIIGLRVDEVVEIHDYTQLVFGEDTALSIYNPLVVDSEDARTAVVRGHLIKSVDENKDEVAIVFDNGVIIRIDMRYESYVGPEALQLNRSGHPPVIWN